MRFLFVLICCAELFVVCRSPLRPHYNPEEFDKFPSYQSVVDKFFTEYSSQCITIDTALYFAKKPTGWFVQLEDNKTKQVKEEPFWTNASVKWQQLSIPAIPIDSVSENLHWINYYFL